jgi:Na+/phosphate symporter
MKNESKKDRIIRAIVGVGLLLFGYAVLGGALQVIAYILGIISIITAITGFCLIYKLLGIDTNKK